VEKSFSVIGICDEINGSEDFLISDIDSESEGNDNGDDCSIGSDSE
jgi:hypothetical protein